MFDALGFEQLVSGRRRGLAATALRYALKLASLPYSSGIRLRNQFYNRGVNVTSVSVPVISVGNLTLGGTGKSPCIAWLANWLRAQGKCPAIVSRGYRAVNGQPNDEAQELASQLPDVPHVQNSDRVAASRQAIDRHGCDVILLDDGFQHRRLFRDLDIVLLDATRPFGYDKLFPAGMLREPVSSLCRADVVILTRSDAVSKDDQERIHKVVRRHAPEALWIKAHHTPVKIQNRLDERHDVSAIADWHVAGFCGIGNPTAFSQTLAKCAGEVVDFRAFPDHHPFQSDANDLHHWTESLPPIDGLVCTGKDLVKFDAPRIGNVPLWALMIEMQLENAEALEELLRDRLGLPQNGPHSGHAAVDVPNASTDDWP